MLEEHIMESNEYQRYPGEVTGDCSPRGRRKGGTTMTSHIGLRIGGVPIVVALVLSSAPALVRGQAAAPAFGSRVAIKPGAVLKIGSQVADTGKAQNLYSVERANGDWL